MLHDAVLVIDGSGRIVFANRAVAGIFGHEPDELVDGPLSVLIPPRYRADHDRQIAAYRAHGRPTSMGDRPLLQGLHRDGHDVAVSISLSNLDLVGERYSIAVVRDAAPLKQQLGLARAQAETDPLTGLGNRLHLSRRLHDLLADAEHPLTLAYLDLARFKLLNDTHGHLVGDEVLRIVARRIQGQVRDGDIAARMGGDEFVVVFDGLGAGPSAEARLQALALQLAQPMQHGGRLLQVLAHIGSAVHPRDGGTQEALLACADRAMYAAKRAGQEPR